MADYDITFKAGLNTDDVQKAARSARKEIADIFSKTSGKETSASFKTLELKLRDISTKSRSLSQELRNMANVQVPTEKFQTLENDITKTINKVTDLQERMKKFTATGGKTSSRTYQIMDYELSEAKTELKKLRGQRAYMRNLAKNAYTLGSNTDEYKTKTAQLEKYNEQLAIGISRLKQMKDWEKANSNSNILQGQQKGSNQPSFAQQFKNWKDFTGKVQNVDTRPTNKLANSYENVRKAATGAWQAVKRLASATGRGIVKGAKTLGQRMLGIRQNVDETKVSLKNLTTMALKYGLGLRSIFILYKRLRSAGVEAYKGLASQFPELQAELDQLKISFAQLKNSLATMAQPILSYLVPAIKTLMSWLVAAMNALANFFAILTGQKYIYKATKNNNALAKSIGGAGKAAKEANEDIAEYDNLILIQQDKDSGGGGGSGDIDEYTGAWEKVAAESDFAQQLKDAINRGDWEGVGALFADKLNVLTDKFDDWVNNTFRPEGKKWAKRLGDILNGFVDKWNSFKSGQTLSDALMSVMDISATWWETVRWKNLGSKVAGAINGIFTNWEPSTVARFLVRKLNAVIEFVAGLIDKDGGIDWKLLGSRIGQTIKETIERIEWKQLGADLSGLASGILEAISEAIKDSQLGVTVGNAINEFLRGIDFGRLATDLSEVAINLLDALADLLETTDWEAVGQAIADFLTHIQWGKLLATLGRVALALVKGLGKALLKIATDPAALGSIATGLLTIFGAKWLWGKITGLFKTNLTDSLKQGAAGVNGSAIGNVLAGVMTFEAVGSKAASLFADWAKGTDLESYYREFAEAPITGTVKATVTAIGSIFEESSNGKSTFRNAVEMMSDDIVSGMFGDINEKHAEARAKNLEESEKYHQQMLDMLQRRYEAGEKLNENSINILVENGRISKEAVKSLEEDSNHYAEIAKSNAEITKLTTEEAIASSNHYVEIAQANAGYVGEYSTAVKENAESNSKSVEEVTNAAIESSNHYVEIAQANAGHIVSYADTAKANAEATKSMAEQAQQTAQHYVDIAQANAKTTKDMIKEAESNIEHSVSVAKSNSAEIKDTVGDTANAVKNAFSDVPEEYETTFTNAYNAIEGAFSNVDTFFNGVAEGVKAPFSTMAQFFEDTFTTAWGNVVKVFQTNTPEFQSIQDSISGSFKTMINGMISGVNNTLSGPFTTLKGVLDRMRNMTVGDQRIFAGLPSISIPKIPKLAQGAVLPPNNPFIAMVGDQKSGTNVEAPLDTIAEALRQVLSENRTTQNQTIVLQLNGRQIAQAVWDEENKRYKQTGARFSYS